MAGAGTISATCRENTTLGGVEIMKIDKVKVDRWRAAIAPLDTPSLRDRYKARAIPRANTVKDINVRYAHDLFWAAVDYGYITYDELRGYNDAHIATALRNIVPPVEVAA
jgi:hypothetical protein